MGQEVQKGGAIGAAPFSSVLPSHAEHQPRNSGRPRGRQDIAAVSEPPFCRKTDDFDPMNLRPFEKNGPEIPQVYYLRQEVFYGKEQKRFIDGPLSKCNRIWMQQASQPIHHVHVAVPVYCSSIPDFFHAGCIRDESVRRVRGSRSELLLTGRLILVPQKRYHELQRLRFSRPGTVHDIRYQPL